ncbi:MAG TPA: hypothetical protein VL307_15090 [Chitinophagaceae bacterium]|nr:hypothetical protein [Chitinophagaceae bacterium]
MTFQRLFIFFVLLLSMYVLPAQQDKPNTALPDSLLKGMSWRNIGPNRGGRSLAIAGSANRKSEYYFGAVGGGLWKTINGGATWKPVTDGQIRSSSVGAVAVAASNPDVVYIGMGETEFRGNIMQGDGVYKSVDAGKTWKHMGLANTQSIARIRIDPRNADIAYVAALGHAFGPNEERGVFKTTDGGATWKKILYKGERAGAEDLVIDPVNPDIIYATIWEVYRTPYKMWGGGGASGLFKSTDGGASWTELTHLPGMPEGTVGKIGVAVSPVDHSRVWAIVEAADGGLYRSEDGGAHWKLVNSDRKIRQRAFYYSRIVADPQNKEAVYALNVNFYKSTDGGVHFNKSIKLPHGDNHDLWIDPTDSLRMAEANDGGGTISVNGGEAWTDEDFPTAQLYHITVTNDFPYHVAGAQQDNSTIALPSEDWRHRTINSNSTKPGMGYAYDVGGGESGYIAQDPKDPAIFYAGSQGALLTRINRNTGQQRDVQVYPRFFSGEEARVLPERWQWTYPIVFSPVDHQRLYTCSQHVWMTTDEGQTWKRISPDLTYADTSTLGTSGGVITRDMNGPEIYATVFALAPSYFDANTLWAGSDDGLVHLTQNNGGSWQNITPPDMQKNTRVSIIEASHFAAGKAYVAAKRYQMDDRMPYIWKTADFGKTWTKIVSGLPDGDYVHCIREDITRAGLLYAGTEHGVFVSYDDGAHWQSLRLNLPDVQVADLAVTEKDIVIGTHGRSIYILDDVSPVREYQQSLADTAAHLFTPYYAVRNVQDAVFQYYLARETPLLSIDIIDPAGKLVQSFKGAAAPPKDSIVAEDEDDRKPPAPGIKAGMNIFTWNLRYPPATSFKGMILWGASKYNGPLAPPGIYQVRLNAGGKTIVKSFEIKLDPRLQGVSIPDVNEQFALVSKIRDEVSLANEAVIKIRGIKAALTAQKNAANHADFIRELSLLEEKLYQVRNQSSQDPLNFPIKVNNRLAALARSIETGDNKPTAASYKVFDELSTELHQYLAALESLLQQNKKLVQKVKPLTNLQPN